jgi:hypothetical protein
MDAVLLAHTSPSSSSGGGGDDGGSQSIVNSRAKARYGLYTVSIDSYLPIGGLLSRAPMGQWVLVTNRGRPLSSQHQTVGLRYNKTRRQARHRSFL